MEDPNQEFFDKLSKLNKRQFIEGQEAALEEQTIKHLLAHSGRAPSIGMLVNHCRRRTGSPQLTLHWFYDVYPLFPLRLFAAKVAWAHKGSLREIFDRFPSTGIFKAYARELAAGDVDDRHTAVGLVFRDVRRYMLLHNAPQLSSTVDGTTITYRSQGVTYAVEPLDRVLLAIGGDWAEEPCLSG